MAEARAQSGQCSGVPCPPGFTFHVYVDPIFGDDGLAFELNPKTAVAYDPRRKPLANYPTGNTPFPDTSFGANNGSGILQHAPYSFRTLTGGVPGGIGGRGAIDYVLTNWASASSPAGRTLPWTNAENGRVVWWVIIHLLPGLYGPDSTIDPTLTDVDPQSGLRFNGEAFPLFLPTGVSLQGTSALDTILDARKLPTGIIQTNGNLAGRQANPGLEDYFVDSLTLRNARVNGAPPVVVPPPLTILNTSGAAIWFGWELTVQFTVSNCFLVDNDVGIALEDSPLAPVNSPILVNNTLAWNRIGIWNGTRDPSSPSTPQNQGNALAVCFNNIIDTSNPKSPTLVNVAAQGMHQDDVTITAILTALGQSIPPQPQTLNAWDPSRINVALPDPLVTTTWPMPVPRQTPPPTALPAPIVDLTPFMATATKPRGILFVNDALTWAGFMPGSPHDLRLAPHVATDPRTITPSTPITQLNPLVNVGIALGDTVPILASITFANGFVVADKPGIRMSASNSLDVDEFNSCDWDCDGFANPRIRCRAGFADPPQGLPPIDLGADEMDALIVADYIESTRMYGTVITPDGMRHQTAVAFLDLRGPTHPRPVHNNTFGHGFAWWQHTRFRKPSEGCNDCATVTLPSPPTSYESNYTAASTPFPGSPPGVQTYRNFKILLSPTASFWPSNVSGSAENKPPIMRNLQCDFAPLLLSDPTPYWGQIWFGLVGMALPSPRASDVYSANPWHGSDWWPIEPSIPNPEPAIDNWNAYSNPTHPTFPSAILSGSLHSPGTTVLGSRLTCGALAPYLLPGLPTPTFGSFAPCSGGSNYTIGPFGVGDASTGCPDLLPYAASLDGVGIRWNLQKLGAGLGSNLQTFLSVITEFGDEGTAQSQTSSGGSSRLRRLPYPGPRLEESQVRVPSLDQTGFDRIRVGEYWPRSRSR